MTKIYELKSLKTFAINKVLYFTILVEFVLCLRIFLPQNSCIFLSDNYLKGTSETAVVNVTILIKFVGFLQLGKETSFILIKAKWLQLVVCSSNPV